MSHDHILIEPLVAKRNEMRLYIQQRVPSFLMEINRANVFYRLFALTALLWSSAWIADLALYRKWDALTAYSLFQLVISLGYSVLALITKPTSDKRFMYIMMVFDPLWRIATIVAGYYCFEFVIGTPFTRSNFGALEYLVQLIIVHLYFSMGVLFLQCIIGMIQIVIFSRKSRLKSSENV
jgi:small-conductance mechanosensitive channel